MARWFCLGRTTYRCVRFSARRPTASGPKGLRAILSGRAWAAGAHARLPMRKGLPFASAQSDRSPTRPGTGADGTAAVDVFPSISQIEAWPLVFEKGCRNRRIRRFRWRANSSRDWATSPPPMSWSRSFPRSRLGRCSCFEKDVGMAVVIEIARPDRFPTRPGIGADRSAADQFVSVHFPDRDLAAARVLKKDVGMAIAVEVACSDRLPSGQDGAQPRRRLGFH